MAITYLEVDTGQLQADAKELKEVAANAKKELDQFKEEMDVLCTMWKGKTSTAFAEQVNSDYARMMFLLNKMQKLSFHMEHARKEYENCEKTVQSSIDAIRI